MVGLSRQAIQLRERKIVNKLRKVCGVAILSLDIPLPQYGRKRNADV